MGCYQPRDPKISFCAPIETQETLLKIVNTSRDWYLNSEYNAKKPEFLDRFDECYNDTLSAIDEYEDEVLDHYAFAQCEESLFDEYLYNIVPFSISYVQEQGMYLTVCTDKNPESEYSSYKQMSNNLYYGDKIQDIMCMYKTDFENPLHIRNLKDFLKFLNDADINYLKKEFDWRFLHSDWD